jgi:molybdate transport system substrate-binding protein
MAATIRIISSMATRQLLADLVDLFERGSPNRAATESVGGVDAAKRVRAGEAFDVVVLAANVIDQLTAEGHLVAGSRADLVRSGVAVAVKAGAPQPEIATEDALRRAVVGAASLSYSTGPSGIYLTQLFERWGIADQIKDRIVQAPPGVPVGSLVAAGEVELGFQQLSELMNLPGITVLGPLPEAIQTITTFSAGVSVTTAQADAARELLAFMASAAAVEIKLRNGMDPA